MAIRKSVITIEINNIIYYSMDNRGCSWSNEINDAKQHRGMANAKHRQIKEHLEGSIRMDSASLFDIYLKNQNNFSWGSPTAISYNEVNTILLHELFLSI